MMKKSLDKKVTLPTIISLFFALFACDDRIQVAKAPVIELSTNQVVFSTPDSQTNESQFTVTVRNAGNADLIIAQTKLEENPPVSAQETEFAILDFDDWNNRLVIGAGSSKDLEIVWRPLDGNRDRGSITIVSNVGSPVISLETTDIDPEILVTAQNPALAYDSANKPLLLIDQAMFRHFQKTTIELKSTKAAALSLSKICVIDDMGLCQSNEPLVQLFSVCANIDATIGNCQPLPASFPVLSFDNTYRFALLFHAIENRESGFAGRLRIVSNSASSPDMLINLKASLCERTAQQPSCGSCGDGLVDDVYGEQCDDGNLDETDGCYSNCRTTMDSCSDGALGCPCRNPDNSCDLGLICDTATNLCTTCDGGLGCPCPCKDGFICNENNRCVLEGNPDCIPTLNGQEACDGIDNDCDRNVDEGLSELEDICDGIDNNCNGAVDEAFDLNTDVSNCGACQKVCLFDHAIPNCQMKDCVIQSCEQGYFNINQDEADGCEYQCEPSNDRIEACDLLDNDCDGKTDEGYDLNTNLSHCGACNALCSFDNSNAICEQGQCKQGTCLNGFYDLNATEIPPPADGCEYPCQITQNGLESCDLIDNDCDGKIDEGFDFNTDALHCGECGNRCSFYQANAACENALCVQKSCVTDYYDLNQSDEDGCEYACRVSNDGIELCDLNDNDCDGNSDEGFDLNRDLNHCGACNRLCALDHAVAQCEQGDCLLVRCEQDFYNLNQLEMDGCEYECYVSNQGMELCDLEDNDCDGKTDEDFDLNTNLSHCGACNQLCYHDNANSTCQDAICSMRGCLNGYFDLNQSPVDGCEYACQYSNNQVENCDNIDNDCDGKTDEGFDLNRDVNHCGTCNQVCQYLNAVPLCNQGSCELNACNSNYYNLDQNNSNGCEYSCQIGNDGNELCDSQDQDCDGQIDEGFDLSTDLNNCGTCGRACFFANSQYACINGDCQATGCYLGYYNLDGNLANGCEYQCTAQNQGVEVCDGQDNDCDGVIDDGFDLQTNISHCGACGRACVYSSALAICNQGTCQMGACLPGSLNIDNNPANGCEYGCQVTQGGVELCDSVDNDCDSKVDEGITLSTDVNNCGACGIKCQYNNASPSCVNSVCTMGTCTAGYYNINASVLDGCEYACTFVSASDAPDSLYADSNCDGIDGVIGQSIFVSPAGRTIAQGALGTMNDPISTITEGLSKARTALKANVLVAQGIYTESVTLQSGIHLHGGYDQSSGWKRNINNYPTIIRGNPAIKANALVSKVIVSGFSVEGTDVPNDVNSLGKSSYAIYLTNVAANQLELRNLKVYGGRGANGLAGTAGLIGADATGIAGLGGNGSDASSNGGLGGSGATGCGGNNGGTGGRGGYDSTVGANGGRGIGRLGGAGGIGSSTSCQQTALLTTNGVNGPNGLIGTTGVKGDGFGVILNNLWEGNAGTNGLDGGNGDGGGGGGGGGGSTSCTECTNFICNSPIVPGCYCNADRGGGGGGGGGGGCGGKGGLGGKAGGGSFGAFFVNSSPLLVSCQFYGGTGGTGGSGASGGVGGNGTIGAAGGAYADYASPGGKGGNGGKGGTGGSGGGGSGGVSYCLFAQGGTPAVDQITNTCVQGVGGSGGTGLNNNTGTIGRVGAFQFQ